MKRLEFNPIPEADYYQDYTKVCRHINALAEYGDLGGLARALRNNCQEDLFFLLYFVLKLEPINHPWLVERVKEVQENHDKTLDLWSREHWKSTILTYGLIIQELLNNPEERVAIFSHTRSIAKAFLHRIKVTFETNEFLKTIFPDVLYSNPQNESPKWSLDDGIIIRRKGVYLESSIEAWGLVDGMPTSRHYTIRVYDDIVTKESVSTPEQIKKVDDSFKLSQFLKARGGTVRVVGTRYHFADQYEKMKHSQAWTVRERVGVKTENIDGKKVDTAVFLTNQELEDFKRLVCDGNTYVYNCQMLLNPVAEEAQEFKKSWIKYYRTLPDRAINKYLFVDPASGRKEKSAGNDYTVMWVWGLDPFGNHFLVDLIREKINLSGRWNHLKKMMMKHPTILKCYYESYGMQADIEHFNSKMMEEGVYFNIEELSGKLAKVDRIRKLIPLFENGKVFLPEAMFADDGRNLINEFINEEYLLFPFAPHDDMLDAASRIRDEKAEVYKPMDFPSEDEDDNSNVIQLNNWTARKANSRYANV